MCLAAVQPSTSRVDECECEEEGDDDDSAATAILGTRVEG